MLPQVSTNYCTPLKMALWLLLHSSHMEWPRMQAHHCRRQYLWRGCLRKRRAFFFFFGMDAHRDGLQPRCAQEGPARLWNA